MKSMIPFRSLLSFGVAYMLLGFSSFSIAAGSCDNYTPDINGTVVTCTGVGSTSAGVISTQSNTTVGNSVTVNINSGTSLIINGSTVGIGSAATVVNDGNLNTSAFYFGYGISSGVNGRSQAGGSSITNNGNVYTGGTSASGIYISATNAGSAANTIINTGSITTAGSGANGIQVVNGGAITAINNSGVISAQGANSNGIQVTGAANITNSGTICPSTVVGSNCVASGAGSGNGIQIDNNANANRTTITNTSSGLIGAPTTANYAIYSAQQPGVDVYNYGKITAASATATAINFAGSTTGGSNNTVTIYSGSTLLGGISFNKGNTQETLSFNGLSNTNFNNAVTGLNVINATNGSNVVMNSTSGYELAAGKIAVDGTSSLAISGVIQDQTSPSTAASSIEKSGAGTLVLSGANAYTGGTALNAGTIAVTNNAALGAGALTMADGTSLQANSSVSLANSVALSGASTINTNGNNMGLSGSMTGSGGFTKTGTGTLTLSGTNAYSGGTTVSAGTLAGNTSSIQGNVINNAIVNFSQSTNGTYAGVMSGSGSLVKDGSGTVTISKVNTYTGDTNINAGGLILTGSTTSNTSIAAGANLQGSGVINGNVSNSGTIAPSFTGTATNLTVNGNYVGNNGAFVGGVYAPVASPVADTLTVAGNATGSTGLAITDKGGLGNRTTGNGIPVVIVNGTSASNAFALTQRVAAGAYEYQLYKGGASGAGNSWYLSTQAPTPASTPGSGGSTPSPVTPVVPVAPVITPAAGERIEVAVYPAIPSLVQLYAQTAVDTLDQRRGDLNLVDPQGGTKKSSNDWARIIGKTGISTPSSANDGPKMSFNAYALQLGVDVYQNEEQSGSRSYVGPYVTIGSANANTSSQTGGISTGSINGMQAYSLGLYGTHFAANGLYVDALAQGTRYLNAGASSVQGAQLRTQGSGFTGSLEGGGRWNFDKFLISPQAQIVYDAIGLNNATDAYGQVNFNKSEMTRGRLGLLAGHKDVVGSTPIFAYLRASYWSIFNAGTSTTMASLYGVNPITFQSQANSRWMTVDAELNARITKDTNLFLNLAVDNSLMGTYQAYSGRIGLQTRF
ncbi:autotransporter outer membrane beta-barrel domain-containing protein [Polynucleobacter sp. AP-Reno-20A-A9]|uniref:autotransporter outer membrane beta-barrel domain-containing protein n=1 Tax=Polynucleobacter sp. AP-Reno-20A-A9 TaxID=2576925 RepID=UPI001C0E3D3C|nr:autotransporter outer membrane beta-barrel domain-containing protein [Polynucleobacter sp. AP-Reno-20A-A9]MBU3628962.1 autotransporter outer membrane beta-barrel domain-containing protein [Polynucleobacter sp. AP-Reno-20A-A9]